MGYKTILVHVDNGNARHARIDLACTLARRFGAQLVGMFATATPLTPVAPEAAPFVTEALLHQQRAAAEEAGREFVERMRIRDLAARSDWYAAHGDGFPALRAYARHADLVIAGQPDPEGDGVPAGFSHDLVMEIGRPVLYVPFAGRFDDCGAKAFVPWNFSREAARAMYDGLPFLRSARAVEVVTFDPEKLSRPIDIIPPPDLRAYLSRHDVSARVSEQPSGGIDIGSAILSRAADTGADLIVMGAYSHSRARELILGGATRELFKSMTVPTLMSR
jgi:nucleotide-binding universal stress UspA family protein